MIIRFLKLAARHALRFRTYSLINIGGLAVGLASAIAILLFVAEEFSYDQFHDRSENVYRMINITQRTNGTQPHAAGSPLLAPSLMADFAEVDAAVRLRHADDVLVRVGDKKFYENKVFYADSNFFKVLSFHLQQGDEKTALKEINSAVITDAFAQKFFDGENPIGKLIQVNDLTLKITGVTAPTGKSHFQFDMLISFETFTVPAGYPVTLQSWGWTSFPTYVRLKDGATREDVESKLPDFLKKYLSPEVAKKVSYQLQPVADVYLHSRNILERDGISTKGDYNYTITMGAIAALILGIACFNFMNLTAALSIYRVKETGVKRVMGSDRSSIFLQFIAEQMLTVSIGVILALLIIAAGQPPIEGILGTTLTFTWSDQLKWIPFYLAIILMIGISGGLYPAILLSRLTPQTALKGKNSAGVGMRGLSLRKVIIVFQFFITAALIATSFTIKNQMDFLAGKDLGFEKEGLIALRIQPEEMPRVYSTMKNKLSHNLNVKGVSGGRNLFDGSQAGAEIEEVGVTTEESVRVGVFNVYPNFTETVGLELLEGRTLLEGRDERGSFILNETAVKMLGWKDAVGRKVTVLGQTGEVVGVVKDFHFSSLHSPISPLVLTVTNMPVDLMFVRVQSGKIQDILNSLESDWKAVESTLPFDYILLDEHIAQMYRQDRRFSKLAYVFCGLSVLLACLGLHGIISFMTESRTKEIGIRKVLGASVFRITALLSGQFMVWVAIAALIALPVSDYLLKKWLSEFAYRVDVSIAVLVLSVVLSSILAAMSVSFKSIRAARANPVDSLRTE